LPIKGLQNPVHGVTALPGGAWRQQGLAQSAGLLLKLIEGPAASPSRPPDGRCPVREGQCRKRVETNVRPDVSVSCELCASDRFTTARSSKQAMTSTVPPRWSQVSMSILNTRLRGWV